MATGCSVLFLPVSLFRFCQMKHVETAFYNQPAACEENALYLSDARICQLQFSAGAALTSGKIWDHNKMSRDMRFPTMWYVRPTKPQISLRIRAVWSEPLLVAWVFYVVKLLTEHH